MKTRQSTQYQSLVSKEEALLEKAIKESIRDTSQKANHQLKSQQQRRRNVKLESKKFSAKSQKSCLHTTKKTIPKSILNFLDTYYFESAEQMKTRLHSHLLTGRFQNPTLRAFATELILQSSSKVDSTLLEQLDNGYETSFRIP